MCKLALCSSSVIRKQHYGDCWLKLIEPFSQLWRCFLDPGWKSLTGSWLEPLNGCSVNTGALSLVLDVSNENDTSCACWLVQPLQKQQQPSPCFEMTTNTLAEDGEDDNQAVVFLKRQIVLRPLGYEHNEQTIETNGWTHCPLQSVWAHLSHKVRSPELWEGFRGGAASFLCKGSFSARPCILLGLH